MVFGSTAALFAGFHPRALDAGLGGDAGAERLGFYISRVTGGAGDTTKLQAELASGRHLWIPQGAHIDLKDQLIVSTSGQCLRGGNGASLWMNPAFFDNQNPLPKDDPRWAAAGHPQVAGQNKYGARAVGILVGGSPDSELVGNSIGGFTLYTDREDGRFLQGVVVVGASNPEISDMKLTGFGNGSAIAIQASDGGLVHRNQIFSLSEGAAGKTRWAPNVTGITVGGDFRPSRNVTISDNDIADITAVGDFLTTYGLQCDGINMAGAYDTDHTISNNVIRSTGEGVDNFSAHAQIHGNMIADCAVFGIKLIYGAAFTQVSGNSILRSGKAGVVVTGNDLAPMNDITLSDNVVEEVGVYQPRADLGESACIFVWPDKKSVYKAERLVSSRNRLNPGRYGTYTLYDGSTGEQNSFNDYFLGQGAEGWCGPGRSQSRIRDLGGRATLECIAPL